MTEQIQKYKDLIREILEKDRIWDLSDSILYDMCKKYPLHNNPKEIITKTLIIGRVYSVQLERRKNKEGLIGDKFYEDKVIPTFLNSGIDDKLSKLRSKGLSPDVFDEIFHVHKFVMNILRPITDMNKRSFSSKYLHFHLPNLFFLYDSRLRQSVSLLNGEITKDQTHQFLVNTDDYDIEYVKFFLKCYNLKNELQTILNRNLTIRKYDTVMIELSNYITQKKMKV